MKLFHDIALFKKCGKISATLLVLFLLLNSKLNASNFLEIHPPKDSLKNKYALSDPRNPDCPCHLYQKKAEREFEQGLKSKIKLQKTEQKQRLKEIKYLKFNLTIKRLLCSKNTASKNLSRKHNTRRHHCRRRDLFKKNIATCTRY